MADPIRVPPGFDDLSIEEKIDYVQTLWDRIAADADAIPLTEWQKRVLEKRVAEHEADPGSAIPWETVRDRLRRKLAGNE